VADAPPGFAADGRSNDEDGGVSNSISTAALHHMVPFAGELGVEIESATSADVVARAPWAAQRCTAGGALHGGYLMSVADTIGAVAAFLRLPDGAQTSTIESKTNFFRPVTAGTIHVTSHIVHAGTRTIVVQTDITNDDGKLVSRTTQTQSVLTADL